MVNLWSDTEWGYLISLQPKALSWNWLLGYLLKTDMHVQGVFFRRLLSPLLASVYKVLFFHRNRCYFAQEFQEELSQINVLSNFLSLSIMQRKILIVLPFIHWMLGFYVLSYLRLAAQMTTYLFQSTSASLAWFVFNWMARPVSSFY